MKDNYYFYVAIDEGSKLVFYCIPNRELFEKVETIYYFNSLISVISKRSLYKSFKSNENFLNNHRANLKTICPSYEYYTLDLNSILENTTCKEKRSLLNLGSIINGRIFEYNIIKKLLLRQKLKKILS